MMTDITDSSAKELSRGIEFTSSGRDTSARHHTEPHPATVEESEQQAATVQQVAYLGRWEWDVASDKVIWTDEMYHIFGLAPQEPGLTYRTIAKHIHPADRAQVSEVFKAALREQKPFSFDHRILSPDGTTRTIHSRGEVITNDGGRTVKLIGTALDVTGRRRAEDALRESEELYRQMFEKNWAVQLLIDPESGGIVDANQAACRFYGYSLNDLKAKRIADINTLPEKEVVEKMRQAALEKLNYFFFRHQLSSGEIRDVEVHSSPVNIQSRTFLYSIIHDVTERKLAEHERSSLLRRLVTAHEDERRRIARELHDQLGQHLTALMLGLKSLEDADESSPSAKAQIQRLTQLTDQLGREVHRLAWELRPAALDDWGLHTALSNYAEEWAERSGIKVDFHSNGLLERRLLPDIETTVYRIVQESLTNILKHAEASRVSVLLEYRQKRVMAIVEDNGRGFDVESLVNAPDTEHRLGLIGMQERVALVGGTIDIESTSGTGTTIFLHIPIPPD
jgi:PAS domain S-box-containing protein